MPWVGVGVPTAAVAAGTAATPFQFVLRGSRFALDGMSTTEPDTLPAPAGPDPARH